MADSYNIKTDRISTGKRIRSLGELDNPIESEIQDVNDPFLETFNQYNLVPYFGTQTAPAHATMLWLIDLARRSPSHAACIEAKKRFCFEGVIDVVKQKDTMFYYPEEQAEVTREERENYYDSLKRIQIPYAAHMRDFTIKAYDNYAKTGNVFVVMSIAQEAGINVCKLEVLDTQRCVYEATQKGEVKQLVIAPYFDYKHFSNFNPEILPVSEFTGNGSKLNFAEVGDIKKTVFHLKNNVAGKSWYGEPDYIAAFRNMYQEFQNISYVTKETEQGFKGTLLLEFAQGDDADFDGLDQEFEGQFDFRNIPTDPADERNKALESTFTNAGYRNTTLAVSERPTGASPFSSFHLAANTNERFYATMKQINEGQILKVHGLSNVLLGGDKQAGSIGAESFTAEFKVRNKLVFEPLQNKIAAFNNRLLDICFEAMGLDLQGFSIKYRSTFQMHLDAMEAKEEEEGNE
jgi:hypothetical protein